MRYKNISTLWLRVSVSVILSRGTSSRMTRYSSLSEQTVDGMNSDTGLFLVLFVWTPDVTSSFIYLQRTTKKKPRWSSLQTHHLEEAFERCVWGFSECCIVGSVVFTEVDHHLGLKSGYFSLCSFDFTNSRLKSASWKSPDLEIGNTPLTLP